MDTTISTNKKYKQVTVDVPEERVAEFHAFFARFLAVGEGRRRGRRHGRPEHRGHGRHGGACSRGHRGEESSEAGAHERGAEVVPGGPTAPTTAPTTEL